MNLRAQGWVPLQQQARTAQIKSAGPLCCFEPGTDRRFSGASLSQTQRVDRHRHSPWSRMRQTVGSSMIGVRLNGVGAPVICTVKVGSATAPSRSLDSGLWSGPYTRPMGARHTSNMTIGAVAKRAGIGIDTIRYYERERLLPPPRRRASGYREYDAPAVDRLRFIRHAKQLGFTLDEIRELLALSSDHAHGVSGVKHRAQARLVAIEQRIHELQRVRRGLKKLIDECPGHGDPAACPILGALTHGEQT